MKYGASYGELPMNRAVIVLISRTVMVSRVFLHNFDIVIPYHIEKYH